MSTRWKIPAHQPYSFVMRDRRTGLDVWRNNVTGYYEDWLPGRNPLESGRYAGEAAP
jgi:hypothetical protein